jgi:effector-binding domain-containing protein
MPLDEIAEILDSEEEITHKLLARHRDRLTAQLADQERMLAFLEALIDEKRSLMPYQVIVKEVDPVQVAAVRAHVTHENVGEAIATGFGDLMAHLRAHQAAPASAPFIVFHDIIDDQTAGDIELCVPIQAPIPEGGCVRVRLLEGGAFASTVHRGRYTELAPAYHALAGWIQEHGHETAGPPHEIYLNDPQLVGEDEQLTEVAWPIEDFGGRGK